jgi:molybdenum cofactor guanylyltransferase
MPEQLENDITGIILVGGKSRRMGRDKAFLPIAGKPILERVVEVFQEIFPKIALVGNHAERFADSGLPVLPDIYPGSALGGIYTALHHATTQYVFVSSCDIPFPNLELIRNLCLRRKGADAVVVRTPQGCEPLFALYSTSCLGAIKELLESGDCCAYGYYPKVRVRYVPYQEIARFDLDGRALLNVNTPEDYAKIGGAPWK